VQEVGRKFAVSRNTAGPRARGGKAVAVHNSRYGRVLAS